MAARFVLLMLPIVLWFCVDVSVAIDLFQIHDGKLKFSLESDAFMALILEYGQHEFFAVADMHHQLLEFNEVDPAVVTAHFSPWLFFQKNPRDASVEIRAAIDSVPGSLTNGSELITGYCLREEFTYELLNACIHIKKESDLFLPKLVRFDWVRMGYVTNGMIRLSSVFTMLHRGRVLIDVGVECGTDFTIPGLEQHMIVYAFEPHPGNRKCLQQSILPEHLTEIHVHRGKKPTIEIAPEHRKNGHVFLFDAAVSNRSGEANLFVDSADRPDIATSTWSSLAAIDHIKHNPTVTVATVRLDDIIDDNVLALKTDTEGFEFHVLEGAQGILEKHLVPYIFLEFSPYMLSTANRSAEHLLDFLNYHGYEIFHAGWDNFWSSDTPFLTYARSLGRERGVGGYWTELVCVRRMWKGQLV